MQSEYNHKQIYSLALCLLLQAIVGFSYVKWLTYHAKAFQAQANHSVSNSTIYNSAHVIPSVSFTVAIDYAMSTSKSIWKAMLLGFLLGSGVKVLCAAPVAESM